MSDLIDIRDVLLMLQGGRASGPSLPSSASDTQPGGAVMPSGSFSSQMLFPSVSNANLASAQSNLSHQAAADSGTLPFADYLARLTSASRSSSNNTGWPRHPAATGRPASESQLLATISSSVCSFGPASTGRVTNDPEVQQNLMEMVMGRRALGAQVGAGTCLGLRVNVGGTGGSWDLLGPAG